MNDKVHHQEQSQQEGSGRKPDFLAYNVTNAKDGKGYFNQVGAAWMHKDGQGLDVQLNSMPISGRVTLRELRDEQMQEYSDQAPAQKQAQDRTQSNSRGRAR